ncbi:shikimate dehydrogenase family protein [Sphingomicrobium lutaoense]|uniref:Shikimate dehydrogenase n=1 Tax=Sphingomicrobium lutaoense TaxID=515949 RepID=A0A839Z2L8_9SPHN|nr:shikimate dehydrogenase [Sphingomicrobium lutaoense]MBB3764798.1 shikimate dehydrogenase [Sphingomicrobium lutaoense]
MSEDGLPYAEVIGDPIEGSKSPVIHRFWLEKAGIAGAYDRRRVERGKLDAYLAERRPDPDWRGANVTMPLKLDAIAAADRATDRAVAAGAANLLVPRDGELVAGNSDVGAVMFLLARLHEEGRAMGRITLFGNGGAARAVLVSCRSLGLVDVVIHARNMTRAVKLAVEFGLAHPPRPFTAPVTGDGIINATPLGMDGNKCLNCDVSGLSDNGWVFDLVTAPARTPLIEDAEKRGLAIVDGIDMLVEQAAASFQLFFDAEAPRDYDAELFERLRA